MACSSPAKTLFRMAARIHDRICAANTAAPVLLPDDEWNRLVRTAERIALAERRRWSAARRSLGRDFALDARAVCRQLDAARAEFESTAAPSVTASVKDLYLDLVALDQEFGTLEFGLREGRLSVATDPIELEGVALGRFEIVLSVNELGNGQPYEIVALDENPASGSSDTVHPHVQDGSLCEGEGRAPICAALREGRLFDFFILIRQILETYNPGSAYVSLRQWSGRECRDCGCRASEDDATSCGRCDGDLCYDCSSGCRDCGRTVCANCCSRCAGCDEDVCDRCSTSCRSCADLFCRTCLTSGMCGECSQPQEPLDETKSPQLESSMQDPSLASLHSVCMGQAVVPA